jgi:hypothetical protein
MRHPRRFTRGKDTGCDNRSRGSEKRANLAGAQLRSPELLTVIHNPRQALFSGIFTRLRRTADYADVDGFKRVTEIRVIRVIRG